MNKPETNKLVLSVLPHTERISFDFNDWVYYLIFGFNIDFHRVFTSGITVSDMSEDEFQSFVDEVELQGKEFEKNVLTMIKNSVGCGLHIESYQLFSSDGDSLRSEVSSKIDTKLASIRKSNGQNIEELFSPTRPIIFSLPLTITPSYNLIFNRPSGISIFTKDYRDPDQKKILFFVLNTALNSSDFEDFEKNLVEGIESRRKISNLKVSQMNWGKLENIANSLSTMCHSTFGSNQFSKNSSNLLKYGFSPTGSFLQLS